MSDQQNLHHLQSIFNYVPIHSHLATSGQMSAEELKLIKEQGFTTIINLAMSKGDDIQMEAEDLICLRLGLDYV